MPIPMRRNGVYGDRKYAFAQTVGAYVSTMSTAYSPSQIVGRTRFHTANTMNADTPTYPLGLLMLRAKANSSMSSP